MNFQKEVKNYIVKCSEIERVPILNFYAQDLSGKTHIIEIDFFKLYIPENYEETLDISDFPIMGNKYLAAAFYNTFYNKVVNKDSTPTEFGFLYLLNKFLKNHKVGYNDFENRIENYLKPFPVTNENVIFAISRLINHYGIFDPDKDYNTFDFNIDFSKEGYEAGIMVRAVEFIMEKIDLFLPYKLSFIVEDKTLLYKQKKLIDFWEKPSTDYDKVVEILNAENYLHHDDYGGYYWATPENKTGGKEFANLLLVLEKTGRFNFRCYTEAHRYCVLNNSITLPFKIDSLKNTKIEEARDSNLMKYFEKLIGK